MSTGGRPPSSRPDSPPGFTGMHLSGVVFPRPSQYAGNPVVPFPVPARGAPSRSRPRPITDGTGRYAIAPRTGFTGPKDWPARRTHTVTLSHCQGHTLRSTTERKLILEGRKHLSDLAL